MVGGWVVKMLVCFRKLMLMVMDILTMKSSTSSWILATLSGVLDCRQAQIQGCHHNGLFEDNYFHSYCE